MISLLEAVDPLWTGLSDLDEEIDSPLGEGFTSLDENSEGERVIASSLRKVFPMMDITYRKEVAEKVSCYSEIERIEEKGRVFL